MSDGRRTTTTQTHCDKCRKRSFTFYESRYWYKGSLCGDCRTKVFEEIGICNHGVHDYTVDQGPEIDAFCESPFF
jgi:hypothetical protein